MTIPPEQIQAARDQRNEWRMHDAISAPISPREMVQCMDQHIEYAKRHGNSLVTVNLFELKEWRDMIDRIAGEVE